MTDRNSLTTYAYPVKPRNAFIAQRIKRIINQYNIDAYLFLVTPDVFFRSFNESFGSKESRELLIHHLIETLVDRSVSNYITYTSGGIDVDYSKDNGVDFCKIYEFLKSPPDHFYVPTTVTYNALDSVWIYHPGTSKIPLIHLLPDNLIIKTLMFKNLHPRSDTAIDDLLVSAKSAYRLNELSDTQISDVLELEKFTAQNVQLKFDQTIIELSEDHREISNFTTNKNYTLKITDTEIYINDILLCAKTDKWRIVFNG